MMTDAARYQACGAAEVARNEISSLYHGLLILQTGFIVFFAIPREKRIKMS